VIDSRKSISEKNDSFLRGDCWNSPNLNMSQKSHIV